MAEWRKGKTSLEAELRRAIRHQSRLLVALGRLERKPCAECGASDSQIHHRSYETATDVVWLCRGCHLGNHSEVRASWG